MRTALSMHGDRKITMFPSDDGAVILVAIHATGRDAMTIMLKREEWNKFIEEGES